jgi:hypothetical protein
MPIHDWIRVPPGLFHHFHQEWSIEIARELNRGLLPTGFSALVEQGGDPVKTLGIEKATLDACVREAQHDRVLVTRDGLPVALIVGIEALDEEQVRLGSSDEFWKLIGERRKQKTVTREELEQMTAKGD